MNAKEFIEKYLQNSTYRNELSEEAEAAAMENGLVVVFGASDDLCELRGAIDDEIGCYDGGEISTGNVAFEAVWHDEGDYRWTYDADFPHEEFDVMEDGEKYCRGMVFALSDVKKRSKTKTYGDVLDEFLNVTKIDKETINDYRPCEPPYYTNPILVTAGIDGDVQLKTLADSFDKLVGLKGLTAANLTDKDITVTADDIKLCISARSADKMQAQIINNRPCIVIRLDSPRIDVNGYSVMIK